MPHKGAENLRKYQERLAAMTPEERDAYYASLKAKRKAVTEDGSTQGFSPSPEVDDACAARLSLFRSLLGRYVEALAVQNAWGVVSSIDMCRLCSGGGIHAVGCGCVCHAARAALSEFDASNSPKE